MPKSLSLLYINCCESSHYRKHVTASFVTDWLRVLCFCPFHRVTPFILQENSMECGSATGLIPSPPATLLCVLLVLLHRWPQLAPPSLPWAWLGLAWLITRQEKTTMPEKSDPATPHIHPVYSENARFQLFTCKAPVVLPATCSSAQVAGQNNQCCNIRLVKII